MTIKRESDGTISWDADDFVEYHATGVDTKGRRFKIVQKRWNVIRCYNLYRGTYWGVKADGRRVRLMEVYN